MAVNETIVTGRKFRKLIDAANKQWQRISFWHKASDCEFDDGDTAETKVGAIKGITTDLNTTTTGYAADMTTVASLNSSLTTGLGNGRVQIVVNSDSTLGYRLDGADTVYPFKQQVAFILHCTAILHASESAADLMNFSFSVTYKDGVFDTTSFVKKQSSYLGDNTVAYTLTIKINRIEML